MVAVALGLVQVQAEIVASYDFNDTAASSDSQANTTAGAFAYGSSVGAFSYSGVGVPGKSAYFYNDSFYSTARSAAISAGDYLTFSLDVDSRYAVSFSTLSFYTQRDATSGAHAPDSYSVFTRTQVSERRCPSYYFIIFRV